MNGLNKMLEEFESILTKAEDESGSRYCDGFIKCVDRKFDPLKKDCVKCILNRLKEHTDA